MKRLISLVLIIFLCLSVIACNGDNITTTENGDITTTQGSDNVTTLPPVTLPVKCNHDEEIIAGKEPTTTSIGLTEGKKCTLCGEILEPQSTISAMPVTDGFEYRLNDDNASYTVIGIGDITDDKLVIPSAFNGLPVTAIGIGAFENCENITEAIIPDSITYIGKSAFEYCTNLKKISIPDSVTKLGVSAFKDCWYLTEVKLSNSLSRIENYTFSKCKSLTHVKIPDSVKKLGYSIFMKCESLESVELPVGIPNIPTSMFYDCTSLASITIPEGVTTIESDAFYNCKGLKEMNMPSTLKTLKRDSRFNLFSGCDNVEKYYVDPDNPYFYSVDGVFYSANGILLRYPCGKKSSTFTVPEGIEKIYNGAFDNCDHLENVDLPDTLTYIGNRAFYSCDKLEYIYIPIGVKTIWYEAFSKCPLITISCGSFGIQKDWDERWIDKGTYVSWGRTS